MTGQMRRWTRGLSRRFGCTRRTFRGIGVTSSSSTTPQDVYALPGGLELQTILSVEYPAGEDPPRMCRQVAENSVAFVGEDDVYALRGVLTTATTQTQVGHIVLAKMPETGDECYIEYLGAHALPTAGTDAAVVTVPAQHVEAITAFVEFCALHELETDEAATTTDTSIILSQLGQEARRAWLRYKEVMDRLIWLASEPATAGVQPVWGDIGL